MALSHLTSTCVLLWFNIHAMDGQNETTRASVNTTIDTDASEPLMGWETDNILVIGGAAGVTLAYFLCITLCACYVMNSRKNQEPDEINVRSQPNSNHNYDYGYGYDNNQNHKQKQAKRTFSKQQIRDMNRMVADPQHRRGTNFKKPTHISAFNALHFAPPINHSGANWKQLNNVNSQQRVMQLMHQSMMANQTALAMDYFLTQQRQQQNPPPRAHQLHSYSSSPVVASVSPPMHGMNGRMPVASVSPPMNGMNGRMPANGNHSPYLVPSQPMNAVNVRGSIDSIDEYAANSGELPDSLSSKQSVLSEGPRDAFRFQQKKQKHVHAIAEDEEDDMFDVGQINAPRNGGNVQAKRRMFESPQMVQPKAGQSSSHRSYNKSKPKAKKADSAMGSNMTLPDLPESTFDLNANLR
eukprot:71501_1